MTRRDDLEAQADWARGFLAAIMRGREPERGA